MSMTRPLVQAWGIHIASLHGNNDNNYGDDKDECRRQGLGRKHPAFLHRVAQWQQWQQQWHDYDKCRWQGLVHERTAFSYCVAQWQQQQQLRQWRRRMLTTRPCAQVHGIFISRPANATTTTTTIGNDKQRVSDDEASCASAQHNSHCAQAHMLCVKYRRNNQPDNVKLRRAWATLSNIDATINFSNVKHWRCHGSW